MKKIQFQRKGIGHLEHQFWHRTLAFTIDSYIIRGMALLFTRFVWTDNSSAVSKSLVGGILFVVLFILYASILESARLQATLGKWFFRYKVCDKNRNRISFSKALLRNIAKLIAISSGIGVLIIDMNKNRQGLHDFMVGTLVLRRDAGPNLPG